MLTTDDIRHGYGKTPPGHAVMKDYDKNLTDFDEWLAEHDRQVSEAAWDKGVGHGVKAHCEQGCPVDYDKRFNPYREDSK